MSETPNLDELRGHVNHLKALLDAPEPGLSTWVESYGRSAGKIMDFFAEEDSATALTAEKDLLGTDVPLSENPKETPVPTCSRCGREVPYFYNYVYKLSTTQGVLVMNSNCCPHAGCRAIFMILPVGIEASHVASPGQAGWPGMPDA